jgi:hypothetical protein
MSDHLEGNASTAHNESFNTTTVNLSDDSSSCYYLHPSNNPGALLVFEIFTGENYIVWSRSMTIALTVKNKISFIDGTLMQPITNNESLRVAWLRSNNLVLSWLMNSIAKDIRSSLLYFTSAFDIWEELRIRYLRSDGPRVFSLEKSLSSISQNSKTVTDYFSEFKALWDEYISFRPIPNCKCGNLDSCSCNILKHLTDRQQSDYVMKFLVGLHDSFSAVRSQLLLQTPLLSMGKVFSLLLQEESQRSLTNMVGVSIDSHAKAAGQYHNPNHRSGSTYVTRFSKQKGKSEATCSHCGYPGHLVDKCFQIIGYPPGWKGPKGKRFAATPHTNRNYQTLPIAHNTVASEQKQEPPNIVFSQEQMQNLLTLANSISNSKLHNTAKEQVSVSGISFSCHTNSSPQNNFTWILDTGATDHMICSPILFESIVLPKIQNQVHLPNGQKVPIAFTGTVKFSPDIILNNAFYVPSFNINLIYVSRLTADNTIGLFFLHTKCFLQNLSKWRTIGLAEAESGLYHIHKPSDQSTESSPPRSIIKSCIVATDLWHLRLGHIPISKLNLLNKIDSSVTSTGKSICDICPLAKQKRLSFPLSMHTSTQVFQLIHIDIWGPFSVTSYSGHQFFLTIVDDYSRFTWLFLMKTKSETRGLLNNFLIYVHTQFNTRIQTIRTDNGQEFNMPTFYQDHGIIHQTTCVETPEQNGRVERKHQHLLNVA